MERISNYRLRQLGRLLKQGHAIVHGKTCTGNHWPGGDHYWIVDVYPEQVTYHVPVIDRPSWGKYQAPE